MFRPSFLAALGLVLLMTTSASAQFRGMRFPPSLQNIFMLRGEAVQKELGVTDEQKKTLSELAAQLQAEAMEIISGLQDLSPEEQKEHMPELMKMVGEKGKDIQDKVDKVLDQKQLARMRELSLQSRGAAALEDDEVSAALKISDDQKTKLVAVREEGSKKMEEAMQALRGGGGGGDAGDIRQKMMDMRKELGDKALAVLSSEQREQFEKMKGAKFTFPPQRGPF
jgi:DNA-binding MarR family transcriptional regulator